MALDSLILIKPEWEIFTACDGIKDQKIQTLDLTGSVLTDAPLGVTFNEDFGISVEPSLFQYS